MCHQVLKRRTGGGRVPYGFERVDGMLRFSPTTGPYATAMARLSAGGYTYREIADHCNAHWAQPLPNRLGPLTHQTVWRIVQGVRTYAELVPIGQI